MKNIENEGYDVQGPHEIIWDEKGNFYIAHSTDKVIFTHMNGNMPSYKIQDLQDLKRENNSQFRLCNGVKVDGKNHNWLIFKQYICLGFSYMSFVIKDKIEKGNPFDFDFIFDKDGYDYIFNKSTSFLDGIFVRFNHIELDFVIKNLEKIDVDYLEILNYIQDVEYCECQKSNLLQTIFRLKTDNTTYEDDSENIPAENKIRKRITNSAIHMAVKEGNNISVDMILSALSQTNSVSLKNFNELLQNIIHQKSMLTYFERLPIQSPKMYEKQVLKIS